MSFNKPLIDLQNGLANIKVDSFATEEARTGMLAAARSLCHRIEKPMEILLRIAWIEPAYTSCLKVAIDIGLFAALGENGIGVTKSVEELAMSTNTDKHLLGTTRG